MSPTKLKSLTAGDSSGKLARILSWYQKVKLSIAMQLNTVLFPVVLFSWFRLICVSMSSVS